MAELNIPEKFENLPDNFIVSVLVPSDNYEKVNMHILNDFINKKKMHGIYITINRPYKNIIELMKKDNIDIKKLSFIDCITKEITQKKEKVNCAFVRSPGDLTEMALAIDKLFKHTKHGFILFDSLDTLLVYNNFDRVMKFIHFITGKMRIYGIKGVLLGLQENTKGDLMKKISPFTDKTITLA